MKNPETVWFYKRSSISDACKFFYLWLFGSHDRRAAWDKKATLEMRTNTSLFFHPELLLSYISWNKWMGIQQDQPCFMLRRTETFEDFAKQSGPNLSTRLREEPYLMLQQPVELPSLPSPLLPSAGCWLFFLLASW